MIIFIEVLLKPHPRTKNIKALQTKGGLENWVGINKKGTRLKTNQNSKAKSLSVFPQQEKN